MASLLVLGLITAVITAIGFYFGYRTWLNFNPSKEIWIARVYQLSESVKPKFRNKNGDIISELRLNDLVPYRKDQIIKKSYKNSADTYSLKHLKKTLPDVKGHCVERWGEKQEVNVLLVNEQATIMNFGYDKVTGNKIFTPMPYDDMTLIKNETSLRLDRLEKEKVNVWAEISKFAVMFIVAFMLLGSVYFMADSQKTISDNTKAMEESAHKHNLELTNLTRQAILSFAEIVSGEIPENNNLGKQKINISPLPSIE